MSLFTFFWSIQNIFGQRKTIDFADTSPNFLHYRFLGVLSCQPKSVAIRHRERRILTLPFNWGVMISSQIVVSKKTKLSAFYCTSTHQSFYKLLYQDDEVILIEVPATTSKSLLNQWLWGDRTIKKNSMATFLRYSIRSRWETAGWNLPVDIRNFCPILSRQLCCCRKHTDLEHFLSLSDDRAFHQEQPRVPRNTAKMQRFCQPNPTSQRSLSRSEPDFLLDKAESYPNTPEYCFCCVFIWECCNKWEILPAFSWWRKKVSLSL